MAPTSYFSLQNWMTEDTVSNNYLLKHLTSTIENPHPLREQDKKIWKKIKQDHPTSFILGSYPIYARGLVVNYRKLTIAVPFGVLPRELPKTSRIYLEDLQKSLHLDGHIIFPEILDADLFMIRASIGRLEFIFMISTTTNLRTNFLGSCMLSAFSYFLLHGEDTDAKMCAVIETNDSFLKCLTVSRVDLSDCCMPGTTWKYLGSTLPMLKLTETVKEYLKSLVTLVEPADTLPHRKFKMDLFDIPPYLLRKLIADYGKSGWLLACVQLSEKIRLAFNIVKTMNTNAYIFLEKSNLSNGHGCEIHIPIVSCKNDFLDRQTLFAQQLSTRFDKALRLPASKTQVFTLKDEDINGYQDWPSHSHYYFGRAGVKIVFVNVKIKPIVHVTPEEQKVVDNLSWTIEGTGKIGAFLTLKECISSSKYTCILDLTKTHALVFRIGKHEQRRWDNDVNHFSKEQFDAFFGQHIFGDDAVL